MKTVLAIQVLLVSFKLITAQNDLVDITIINKFEENIKSDSNIKISEENEKFIQDIKFKYWLFDKSSVEVEFGNEAILESSWMIGKPLKIIIHGWSFVRSGEPRVFAIKDAYIKSQEYNIMTLDWRTIASSIHYFQVARLSAQVGIILGHFLINLVKINLVKSSDIHLIGHSVGAHVAAKSGNVFSHEMNVMIDRITGLDPSSPGFKDSWFCLWRYTERLDKDDAMFVDVIHTASGIQGISQPIGHVDFYPNKEKLFQPGCEHFNLFNNLHCCHCRSYLYYIESINSPMSFVSWKCNSLREFKDKKCINEDKNFMGHHANRNIKGKFYLKTKRKSPYSLPIN